MATAEEPTFPTYAELCARPTPFTGTSWGIFGEHDQLGMLNHLTPERIIHAALSIREGRRFNLNLPMTAFDPALISHRGTLSHEMFGMHEHHRDERLNNFFTQASTQIDGLRHFGHPDYGFYNNVQSDDIRPDSQVLGIHQIAEAGIAGRGILLDLDRYRSAIGRPIDHSSSEQITTTDLEGALAWQRTTLLAGDILLIRFGWLSYFGRPDTDKTNVVSAGLEQSHDMAAWLWDHQLALVAADNIALESWPAPHDALLTVAEASGVVPTISHTGMLHRILIPLLGLTIGELWQLDELARWCADEGRHDFFLTAEPLNLVGGVGSPANAIAIV